MNKSYETISKLGAIMNVSITQAYLNAKVGELRLALEYRIKKQEEKEEQKAIRERMREEAKLQKEIEEARKKIAKEQSHYSNALQKINEQIEHAEGAEKEALLAKKKEIEDQLNEIDKSIKDIDYREANAKAGYVYVISNIGSFGENVYKIGMTRRLDPMERVDELGDASVPFNFDVHAAIALDTVERRKRTGEQGAILYLKSGIDQLINHLELYGFAAVLDGGKRYIEGCVHMFAIQVGPTYGGGFRICPQADFSGQIRLTFPNAEFVG